MPPKYNSTHSVDDVPTLIETGVDPTDLNAVAETVGFSSNATTLKKYSPVYPLIAGRTEGVFATRDAPDPAVEKSTCPVMFVLIKSGSIEDL